MTTRYTLSASDGWTEVAGADDDFMIEMASVGRAFVHIGESPDDNSAYHRLFQLDVMVRTGTGPAFVKNPDATRPISVVVTT